MFLPFLIYICIYGLGLSLSVRKAFLNIGPLQPLQQAAYMSANLHPEALLLSCSALCLEDQQCHAAPGP